MKDQRPLSERLRDEGKIEDAIIELVRERDWVSFAEVDYFFGKEPGRKCSFGITGTAEPNAIFWITTEEIGKPLVNLLREKRVHLHPTSLMTYVIDGCALKMPIARRVPKNGFKTERGVVTCLRLVPVEKRKTPRKGRA